jgi:hypothetical protein
VTTAGAAPDQRRCVYCRKPLPSRYVVDAWGDAAHPEHYAEWPACRWCGRLVPEEEGTAKPRVVCRTCAAAAVTDNAAASILIPPVVAWLRAEGVTLKRSVRLLVRVAELGEMRAEPLGVGSDLLGQARVHRQGSTPTRVSLLLLRGLPSPYFEAVAAHELGHAWLACRGVADLPKRAEEGFCEVLSHRWLTWRATEESRYYADRIARNTDPVYGDGFRDVRGRAEAMGFGALIRYIVAHGELPPVGRVSSQE